MPKTRDPRLIEILDVRGLLLVFRSTGQVSPTGAHPRPCVGRAALPAAILIGYPPEMACYLGVLIEQSLSNPRFVDSVQVIHRERDPHGTWVFLVVRIAHESARTTFTSLQSAIAKDRPWYAHFFRGEELVVVYPDRVYWMSTDPETWTDALDHGRRLGIPPGQLDFMPHTTDQAKERFGIDLTALDD